jgi:hypothetical protein
MPADIETRVPSWPWCNIMIEQKHYPALILRWEKHWSNFDGYSWSARVTYLDGDQHNTAVIPATRVSRVG